MPTTWRSKFLFWGLVVLGVWVSRNGGAACDNQGTQYWIAYPNDSGDVGDVVMYMTGPAGTTGTVQSVGVGLSDPFTIPAGGSTAVTLNNCFTGYGCAPGTYNGGDLTIPGNDQVNHYGIEVSASASVAVEAAWWEPAASDSTLALPVTKLGQEYYVMSYPTNPNGIVSWSQFGIVAAQNGTSVTITSTLSMAPPLTTRTIAAGVPYVITLNEGDTYDLNDPSEDTAVVGVHWGAYDLTGTHITSNLPIAVFCGQYSMVPEIPPAYTTYGAENYMYEQLLPVMDWSTQYLYYPMAEGSGTTTRVLASQNGTSVTINGANVATLNSGQFYETFLSQPSVIQANYPVMTAEVHDGDGYNNTNGDPYLMLVPPPDRYLSQYQVYSGVDYVYGMDNYLNMIVPNASIGSVLLDGTAVSAASFTAIGTSGYSGAAVSVVTGTHQVTGPSSFGLQVYGVGHDDGYGYMGGESLETDIINSIPILTETPPFAAQMVGTTYCATANLTDHNSGQPISCAEVDFTVTGVNPQTAQVMTDASGNAQFCYIGVNGGLDQVAATSDSLSVTVSALWNTPSPTPTQTPTPSFTPTPSPTPSPTPTRTPTVTPTSTPTFTPTITTTATPTPTPTPPCQILVWPIPYSVQYAHNNALKVSCLPAYNAEVSIYTLAGELVTHESQSSNSRGWTWGDPAEWSWAQNENGKTVSPGIYFYVIESGQRVLQQGKVIITP